MNLPDSPWSRAYRGVVQLIKTDPRLKTAGVTVLAMDGKKRSLPVESNLPWIRISTIDESSAWRSEKSHDAPLGLVVEVAVASNDVCDLLNLWWAVVRAIYREPEDVDLRAARDRILADAGWPQIDITKQALQATFAEGSDEILTSDGRLKVQVHVSTPE